MLMNFMKLKSHSKDDPMYLISKLLLNSLYGRFGMNPNMENYSIIKSENLMKQFNEFTIVDVFNLNNGKDLVSYLTKNNEEDNDKILNISLPISLAVTAAARIHMTQFKNNPNFNLYYSDTDSIDRDKPLPDKFLGKELGQMKFEHKFKKIMFLAPKVYAGITDDYELVKIKGVKNPVKFNSLLPLLTRNNKLNINQDKWYKSLSRGGITIKEEIYTLMVTENKRNLIYENNKFIDTKPLTLNDTKIINEN
uniref:DNA-directed DNA polymerase n=1 Tax=Chroogomphus rutilus TaxID=85976 RepID=A0A8F0LFR7_9AGAM|nr:DNA-directed DNA polymerase [Chroogomphus rutilus]